jgi:outer membrane protein assembly factor BamC
MRIIATLLLVFAVTGCSWLTGEKGYFRDRSDDYRKAQVEPRIQVPAGMDDDKLQDIYVIPPITEDLKVTGEFEVPRPTPLAARETEELVRIQRLGEEEWMLAAMAPGQLWPQVRAFLNNNTLQVARVDARAGIIETNWMKGEGATMHERYRFRIEQGVQRNTSELHVLQMYQAGDIENWPESPADKERSSQMLLALAQYIANATETAPVSMMAQQQISASGKVSLQEDADDTPYIRLELPYYRAWASLERALRESSFRIRDLDRSSGVYYVRYVAPDDEDGGWFDWLFDGDGEDESAELTEQDFVVNMEQQTEDVMRITIVREDGIALTLTQSQGMLSLIKGNIN